MNETADTDQLRARMLSVLGCLSLEDKDAWMAAVVREAVDELDRLRKENEWRPIEEAPVIDSTKSKLTPALLYSPQFGVKSGEVGRWADDDDNGCRGCVSNYSGCAVRDWGTTHWKPIPSLPVEEEA